MLKAALPIVWIWAWLSGCGVLLSGCGRQDRVISPGSRIHHDDFEYAVQRVERMDRIAARPARGVFYVVTFQVENRAKRVEHRWTNDIAYVLDANGAHYDNEPAAQQALAAVHPFKWQREYVTPPGGVASTLLVFDVPREVKEPYLKVRGAFLMGDLFDANQYRHTRVRLF
jgi:hypothetical protein